MATIRISGAPATPAEESWPVDEHTIRVDEMFARRLDTEFASGVRTLLHDPKTGLSALNGEAALEAIAGVYPALEELRQRTLGEAIGPRQRALVEPAINARLDWAAGTIGRLAERATVEVDDASVTERIAGLQQDAETSWHDPAWLRKLGRTTVTELRYQGERRGWNEVDTETRVRGGLSDLYASAVEAAIAKDVDGAANLLAHAREAIDPARLETIDHRLARAREDGFLREVDAALANLSLDPTAPPALDAFTARAAELTPDDATEQVRGRLGELVSHAQRRAELVSHAQRRAERQWNRRQAEAGIAALDWLRRNPGALPLQLPPEVRDWLAPDQVRGLDALLIDGRLRTDAALFEQLDRQMVYEPDVFASLDLDRHRLSLDDEDHARFAGAQKAIAEGTTDPAVARHLWARTGVDRALEGQGIDIESPESAAIRADMRIRLDDFEVIEGRPPVGADIDAIVADAVGGIADPATMQEVSEPFDPRHIVPAQVKGGGGGRGRGQPPRAPAPPAQPPSPGQPPRPPTTAGPGHNRPPREVWPGLPQVIETLRRWFPSSPPPSQPQPQPDTAGPAASGGDDEEKRRRRALEEFRESLKALAPDHEFLKEPLEAGTIPDQATVDRYGKEVVRIVSEKVDAVLGDLTSRSSYEQHSSVRTIEGNVDLRAEFDQLKTVGKRLRPRSGQYGEGRGGELYELPGGIQIGFRMANDIRAGTRGTIPTLDIKLPGQRAVKFHYNEKR